MGLPKIPLISASKFVAVVGLIAATTLTFAAGGDECSARLAVKLEAFNDDFVRSNGVPVTGDFLYPLHAILENFGLKEEDFSTRYRGRSALTIAEGVSEFLPFLLRNGIDAKAVDVWYHTDHIPNNFTGDMMREYIAKYGTHLVQGEAEHIPAPDNSVDMVFIHMLMNNKVIDIEFAKRILSEVIRVVTTKEDARIVGFREEDIPLIKDFLHKTFGRKIEFEFKEVHFELGVFAGMEKESDHLLVIKKLKP